MSTIILPRRHRGAKGYLAGRLVRASGALAGQTDGETCRLPGRPGVKVPPLAANAGTGHRFARSTTEIADGALHLPVFTGKFGLDRIRAHSTSSTGHSKSPQVTCWQADPLRILWHVAAFRVPPRWCRNHPSSSRLPTFPLSPQDDSLQVVRTEELETIIGILLSMQREKAVESITLSCLRKASK